ncbi:MAG TPA: hypothetical protein VK781_00115 [Solirubrobacteraceae bacterium]|jgi:hypothetical protein|nr:hypothetical protein [Solirubrobacteraceae bacterium]
MTTDSMARLAAANPVPELPEVESAERLRCLIEDDAAGPSLDEWRHGGSATGRRSRARRRALALAPLCIAASVAGVLLSSGSSGPGVNVAAAAYAATSPGSGIVEAVFVTHIERGVQAGSVLRQREWDDAGMGLRRERVTFTEVHDKKRETHISESASAPGRRETWYRGRLEVSTVPRLGAPPPSLKFRMIFGNTTLEGVEGIALYRALYREGLMRLVGRERRDDRLLWKLESRPVSFDANGRRVVIHTRLVVLVDPKTFLPIVERVVDVAGPGHPTALESNLLSYRRLPSGQSTANLFSVAARHLPRVPRSQTLPRLHSPHRQR